MVKRKKRGDHLDVEKGKSGHPQTIGLTVVLNQGGRVPRTGKK